MVHGSPAGFSINLTSLFQLHRWGGSPTGSPPSLDQAIEPKMPSNSRSQGDNTGGTAHLQDCQPAETVTFVRSRRYGSPAGSPTSLTSSARTTGRAVQRHPLNLLTRPRIAMEVQPKRKSRRHGSPKGFPNQPFIQSSQPTMPRQAVQAVRLTRRDRQPAQPALGSARSV